MATTVSPCSLYVSLHKHVILKSKSELLQAHKFRLIIEFLHLYVPQWIRWLHLIGDSTGLSAQYKTLSGYSQRPMWWAGCGWGGCTPHRHLALLIYHWGSAGDFLVLGCVKQFNFNVSRPGASWFERGHSHTDDLEEDYYLTSSASVSSMELASRTCFLCNLTASVQCHCSRHHICQEGRADILHSGVGGGQNRR